MPEYIKRTDALRIVDEVHGARSAYHRIRGIPAADVVPVVHGQWMDDGMGDMLTIWKCSLCGYRQQGAFMRYCPHCGARMDGDG